jgi:hypothetical protein
MGFSFGNGWSRPEGIEPCMNLDTCFATFSYKVGQWINARILSLAPSQIFRPRFQLAFVQGIACGTHLKHDCVAMHINRTSDNVPELSLKLFDSKALL